MQFRRFDISGLLEIIPTRHSDERGYFAEIFREDRFTAEAGETRFVQENQSLSVRQGTIRGIHFQTDPFAQGKLVRCTSGAIFDVAVDLRHGSASYGRHVAAELTADNGAQLWIPEGFLHGFCTLAPDTEVIYKVTSSYDKASERGVIWNDPDLALPWPVDADAAVLSDKDMVMPRLTTCPAWFAR